MSDYISKNNTHTNNPAHNLPVEREQSVAGSRGTNSELRSENELPDGSLLSAAIINGGVRESGPQLSGGNEPTSDTWQVHNIETQMTC